MIRKLPVTDTLPWYRQFWPWFLILLPASVVVASIYTAYIAHRGADDLVVDDYYKIGLAINQRLERTQSAKDEGISARIRFGANSVKVNIEGPVVEAELKLSLAHPLEADRDFVVTLARVQPGIYEGKLPAAVAPHWHWTLEQPVANGWRLDGTIESADLVDARSG